MTPDVVKRTMTFGPDDWIDVVEDCMGRCYRMSPPFWLSKQQPDRFSADAFYETFITPVIRCILSNTRVFMYVLVFDKHWFMRPEKYEVQADRSKKINKYPENAKITSEGIWYRNVEDPSHPSFEAHLKNYSASGGAYATPMDKEMTLHPIELGRLLGTRVIRQQLWRHFLGRMEKDYRLWSGRVIMDFDEGGPFLLTSGKCRQAPEFANTIGEGDIAAFFYANLLGRKHHVLVSSIDRDLVLIGKIRAKYNIKPQWIQCNADLSVNVSLIHKRLEGREDGQALGMMMAGTDYIVKKKLLFWVNDNVILDKTRKAWEKNGAHVLATIEDFTALLNDIYRSANASRCRFPGKTAIIDGYRFVLFNYVYWLTVDGTVKLPPDHPLAALVDEILSLPVATTTSGDVLLLEPPTPSSSSHFSPFSSSSSPSTTVSSPSTTISYHSTVSHQHKNLATFRIPSKQQDNGPVVKRPKREPKVPF